MNRRTGRKRKREREREWVYERESERGRGRREGEIAEEARINKPFNVMMTRLDPRVGNRRVMGASITSYCERESKPFKPR